MSNEDSMQDPPPPEDPADLYDPERAAPRTVEEQSGAPRLYGEERVARLEELVAKLAKTFQAEREISAEEREANAAAFLEVKKLLAPQKDAPTQDESESGPLPWMDQATSEQWHQLATWVDWLSDCYEFKPDLRIVPCWPAHPGIVEELSALWAAWRDAAGRAPVDGAPVGDNDAMAFWHDRYLAPTMHRLQSIYATRACRHNHTPAGQQPLTDKDLLPELP